jgi:hypothetical protein
MRRHSLAVAEPGPAAPSDAAYTVVGHDPSVRSGRRSGRHRVRPPSASDARSGTREDGSGGGPSGGGPRSPVLRASASEKGMGRISPDWRHLRAFHHIVPSRADAPAVGDSSSASPRSPCLTRDVPCPHSSMRLRGRRRPTEGNPPRVRWASVVRSTPIAPMMAHTSRADLRSAAIVDRRPTVSPSRIRGGPAITVLHVGTTR